MNPPCATRTGDYRVSRHDVFLLRAGGLWFVRRLPTADDCRGSGSTALCAVRATQNPQWYGV